MGNSMNKGYVLKGRTMLIGMKTKAFLATLSAMIVLSCPVYAANSTVVGPSSTMVVPQTMLQTNYIEGKVTAWSPPLLTVRGDSYFLEASGQPAYTVKNATMTFRITKKTKFPAGKKRDIQTGISAKVTFLGSPGPAPTDAESVRISGKRSDISSGDADETDTTRGATLVFNNFNDETVKNQPHRTTVFNISKPARITSIRNYHWNNGHGAAPGSIWLVDQKGRKYGPWESSGEPGARGVQNAYWVVSPNVKIRAGTYTIHDSDPATWSQNPRSRDAGMSQVEGFSDKPPKVIPPPPPQTPPSPPHTPSPTTKTTPPSTHTPPSTTTKTTPPSTHTPPSTTTKTTPPSTHTPPSTTKTTPPPATTTQTQGGGWYMEGAPKIEKKASDLVNTGAYFNRSINIVDGSATGSVSWADTTGDRCKGTYTGYVTWTKPPAYMKPGSNIVFKATSKTSANNTCGSKGIGSWVAVKGARFLIEVSDTSPKAPVTYTVQGATPGSRMTIEVSLMAGGVGGHVSYRYVYK